MSAITPLSAAVPSVGTLQAGYGMSLSDLSGASFAQALAQAQGAGASSATLGPQAVAAPNETMQALFKPLNHINEQAASLNQMAQTALAAGADMTPGEMVMLTVRCHEFLFQSQLTTNIANRTSDGLQQLFRQQA